jgi:fucose permease
LAYIKSEAKYTIMTRQNKILVLALACGVFLALGLVVSMLGPSLPYLAQNTGSTLAGVGTLFTALFIGALLAQLSFGPVNDRFGVRAVTFVGLVLMAVGYAGVSISPSLPLALALMFLMGLGDGLVIVSVNVMVSEVFASRSVVALNLSNVFYGVGAVSGPALSSLAMQNWGSAAPAMWTAALVLLTLAAVVPFLRVPGGIAAQGTTGAEAGHAATSIYRSPLLWMLGSILMIYVGSELGLGSWAITYLDRGTGLAVSDAALVTSAFWLSLTAGRLLGAFVGIKLGSANLLALSLAGVVVGTVILQFSGGSTTVMTLGVLVMGTFLGPVYPTVIALTTGSFPQNPGKAASMVMAMGSIGGMIIPWLQGVLLEAAGTYASIAVLLAASLAMLTLYLAPRIRPSHAPGGSGALSTGK